MPYKSAAKGSFAAYWAIKCQMDFSINKFEVAQMGKKRERNLSFTEILMGSDPDVFPQEQKILWCAE